MLKQQKQRREQRLQQLLQQKQEKPPQQQQQQQQETQQLHSSQRKRKRKQGLPAKWNTVISSEPSVTSKWQPQGSKVDLNVSPDNIFCSFLFFRDIHYQGLVIEFCE